MKKEHVIVGAALTGVTLAMIAWRNREAWRQTNKYVVDPDHDCEDIFGFPCTTTGGHGVFFGATHNPNAYEYAAIGSIGVLILGLLWYGLRRQNRTAA